jgi:hypothetical protein
VACVAHMSRDVIEQFNSVLRIVLLAKTGEQSAVIRCLKGVL